MDRTILITGSAGLVGTCLTTALRAQGIEVIEFDIKGSGPAKGDILDADRLRDAAARADGIFHLAALSRVVWGQNNPVLCRRTNVEGVRNVLDAAAASPRKPWVVFSSSREVYGQPAKLPVTEDMPLLPMNVYARSKVAGERLVSAARDAGMHASLVRFSNVYGLTSDHSDRVIPAFAREAAMGGRLRVEGSGNTFDFTHIDDVTVGLVSLTKLMTEDGPPPPPIHFVCGKPCTLGELAEKSVALAGTGATTYEAPARDFDVGRFYGSYARAQEMLGWTPSTPLDDGLSRLIADFKAVNSAA